MIARPKISRNEWKTVALVQGGSRGTSIGAFEVGPSSRADRDDGVDALVVALGQDVAVTHGRDRGHGPVEADEVLAPRRPVLRALAVGRGRVIPLREAPLVDVGQEVALAAQLHGAGHVVAEEGHDDRELDDLDDHARVDAVDEVLEALVEVVAADADAAELEDLEGLEDAADLQQLRDAQRVHGVADEELEHERQARHEVEREPACVEIKSSTRRQCARNRTVRTRLFGLASRTRREKTIRPKISRNDRGREV